MSTQLPSGQANIPGCFKSAWQMMEAISDCQHRASRSFLFFSFSRLSLPQCLTESGLGGESWKYRSLLFNPLLFSLLSSFFSPSAVPFFTPFPDPVSGSSHRSSHRSSDRSSLCLARSHPQISLLSAFFPLCLPSLLLAFLAHAPQFAN